MPARKHKDLDKFQADINRYFSSCQENEKPMTFSGLAYALGFSRRSTLNDYADRDDEMSVPIKRAMLRIEQDYEEGLRAGQPTGSIFALKNRGWTDKQQIEHSGDKDKPVLVSLGDILGDSSKPGK